MLPILFISLLVCIHYCIAVKVIVSLSDYIVTLLSLLSLSMSVHVHVQVMTHPVKLSDGCTYEKSAIQEWLSYRSVSPVTREKLTSKELVADVETKKLIMEYRSLQRMLLR